MCHPEVPAGAPLPNVRTEEVAIELAGGEHLPGLLAFPQRTPAPAVLVINDVFGRANFYEHLTRRIAQAGYLALDVEYFFRHGAVPAGDRDAVTARSGKLDQAQTLRDLGAAIEWLHRRRDTAGARTGLIGFCMGGTFVLDLAAERRDLASVSYYGFPARARPNVPAPLEVAERIRGPLIGHWGTQDTGVGIDNVRALGAKLKAAEVEHTFYEYEGLGHGFLKAFLDDEKTPGHDQACESWKRTLDFYRRELAH